MRRALAAFITFVVLTAAIVFAPVQSADAGTACRHVNQCGYMYHRADEGYDADIIVTCNWGNEEPEKARQDVPELKKATCVDVDGVYVRKNEEIWCAKLNWKGGYYSWTKEWDARGWHQLHATNRGKAADGCVVKRD